MGVAPKMTIETLDERPQIERVHVRVLPDGRVSRRNAALYVGCSPRTLEAWNYAGSGPPPHTVGGRVFYYLEDLDAWIAGPRPRVAGTRTLPTPIAELGLSARTVSVLAAANIIRMRDLVRRSEQDLLRTPNFGRKALDEVREMLAERGLQLAAPRWS
jgi:hypothetical protein